MPIPDVNVAADNNGGPWTSKYGKGLSVTDANGYYAVVVDYNWSGKVTPAKYSYVFEPNSRSYVNVVADHNEQPYTGTLTLTVISSAGANGEIAPSGVTVVNYGSNQTFTATPARGYRVDKWSLDGNDVVIDATTYTLSNIIVSHTVEVTFIPIEYTLDVTIVGNGTVSKSPDKATYHYGEEVTLAVAADAGWTFVGFDPGAVVTMDGNKTVTATFTQNQYTLAINKVGGGTVTADKAAPYHYGEVVTLSATADAGWTFVGFDPGAVVTMDDNKTVTATFTQNEYTLAINKVGSGTVTADKAAPYHYGEVVTLSAAADAGWTFGTWDGGLGAATPVP